MSDDESLNDRYMQKGDVPELPMKNTVYFPFLIIFNEFLIK